LIFLVDGDSENARACFKSASLCDLNASNRKQRGDWLSFDLLNYYSAKLLGHADADDMRDYICQRYNKKYSEIEMDFKPQDAFIVVAAIGTPPGKLSDDDLTQQGLEYINKETCVSNILLTIDGHDQTYTVTEADDIYVQAVTRGQRSMDKILAKKAKEKKSRQDFGETLFAVGGATGGLIGLGVAAIGDSIRNTASLIDASADVRQLQSIPSKLYVWYCKKPESGKLVTIKLQGQHENTIAKSILTIPEKQGPIVALIYFPY
jgi:hypothetical protein